MAIRFNCPQCGKKLKAADQFAGRPANCSRCGAKLVVPVASLPPPVETPPAASDFALEVPVKPISAPKSVDHEELIDMTSMVDVVFFLLIFFLVTSMHALQSSIAMPSPDPQKTSAQGRRTLSDFEADDEYIIVRIDGDDVIWIDDAEVHSAHELLVRLRAAREGPGAPSKMLVLGSGEASNGTAVAVLDAGADAGMDDVRLAIDDDL